MMKNTNRILAMVFVALMCIELMNFVIAVDESTTPEVTTTTVADTTTTLIRRRYFSLSYAPETPLTGDCIILTVTDRSTSDELKDVDVDVNFDGKKTFYGITDANGKFTFCPTKAGSYEVVLDKTRYQTYEKTVPVGQAVVTTTVVTTTVEVTTTEEETTTEEVTTTEEIPATTEKITTTEEVPTTTEVITTTTVQEEKVTPDITIWSIAAIVIVIILVVLYMMTKKKKTEPEEKSKKGKEKEE